MQKVITVVVASTVLNAQNPSICAVEYPELKSALDEGYNIVAVIPQNAPNPALLCVFLTFILDNNMPDGQAPVIS